MQVPFKITTEDRIRKVDRISSGKKEGLDKFTLYNGELTSNLILTLVHFTLNM